MNVILRIHTVVACGDSAWREYNLRVYIFDLLKMQQRMVSRENVDRIELSSSRFYITSL